MLWSQIQLCWHCLSPAFGGFGSTSEDLAEPMQKKIPLIMCRCCVWCWFFSVSLFQRKHYRQMPWLYEIFVQHWRSNINHRRSAIHFSCPLYLCYPSCKTLSLSCSHLYPCESIEEHVCVLLFARLWDDLCYFCYLSLSRGLARRDLFRCRLL